MVAVTDVLGKGQVDEPVVEFIYSVHVSICRFGLLCPLGGAIAKSMQNYAYPRKGQSDGVSNLGVLWFVLAFAAYIFCSSMAISSCN